MIYLGGPYTSHSIEAHQYNIGRLFAYQTWLYHSYPGESIICYPLMTCGYDTSRLQLDYKFWMGVCLESLEHCSIAYFTPGWRRSSGCTKEIKYCDDNMIPWLELPMLTSQTCEVISALLVDMQNHNPFMEWARTWLAKQCQVVHVSAWQQKLVIV